MVVESGVRLGSMRRADGGTVALWGLQKRRYLQQCMQERGSGFLVGTGARQASSTSSNSLPRRAGLLCTALSRRTLPSLPSEAFLQKSVEQDVAHATIGSEMMRTWRARLS